MCPLRHQGGIERPGLLPSASGWGDARPGGRASGLREAQHPLIIIGGQLVDDEIAFQVGVSMHDAHRENRRSLVEQSLGCQGRCRQCKDATSALNPHALICGVTGSPDECENIAGGFGIGEDKTLVHTF